MSTNPYGRQSGLGSSPIAAAAIGAQIFSKSSVTGMSTSAGEIGDTLRIIKNTSDTVTAYIAETQAKSVDTALSYPLAPGEALTLLGPSGIGWGGDLWASSAVGAASIAILKA